MDADMEQSKKSFKIKNADRNDTKDVEASTLEELRAMAAEQFDKISDMPTIHLDSDGTEIDDEEYFRTLDEDTELIAVFSGEHWTDPSHYITIISHREGADTTDANIETARIKQLVGQLQSNLCNVSVMSDSDLDSLSNMDPNSLVDITGKDLMEQLKDSGRPLCAKRNAEERINLLKLLKDGAIFCSERYPEEAEAIDLEISRQLNVDETLKTTTITTTKAPTNTLNSKSVADENKKSLPMNQKTITEPPKIIIEIATESESTNPSTIMEQQNSIDNTKNTNAKTPTKTMTKTSVDI